MGGDDAPSRSVEVALSRLVVRGHVSHHPVGRSGGVGELLDPRRLDAPGRLVHVELVEQIDEEAVELRARSELRLEEAPRADPLDEVGASLGRALVVLMLLKVRRAPQAFADVEVRGGRDVSVDHDVRVVRAKRRDKLRAAVPMGVREAVRGAGAVTRPDLAVGASGVGADVAHLEHVGEDDDVERAHRCGDLGDGRAEVAVVALIHHELVAARRAEGRRRWCRRGLGHEPLAPRARARPRFREGPFGWPSRHRRSRRPSSRGRGVRIACGCPSSAAAPERQRSREDSPAHRSPYPTHGPPLPRRRGPMHGRRQRSSADEIAESVDGRDTAADRPNPNRGAKGCGQSGPGVFGPYPAGGIGPEDVPPDVRTPNPRVGSREPLTPRARVRLQNRRW
jgi:hypothetical protein